jgi:hypothetical protein
MGNITQNERLRQAQARAAQALASSRAESARRTGPPSPGDLYVFRLVSEAALEWLVVLEHPDDRVLLLVVPVDDHPLTGTPDVALPREVIHRPLTARCGQGAWLPAGQFRPRLRVGALPEPALRLVRQKVADLARGRISASEAQRGADLDPEYEEWLAVVEQAREQLQAALDEAGTLVLFETLSRQPPPELAAEPQLALAAEEGDTLVTKLEAAAEDAVAGIRYHQVPGAEPGKLFLLADEKGVQAVWAGPAEAAPPVSGREATGRPRAVVWRVGPKGHLHRGESVFPWIDGQVTLTIGANPPETVTIQR